MAWYDVIEREIFCHSHAPRAMPIRPLRFLNHAVRINFIEMATIELCGKVLWGREIGHGRGVGEARLTRRHSLFIFGGR